MNEDAFQPEIVSPSQWRDMHKAMALSPVRKLQAAVLAMALGDLYRYSHRLEALRDKFRSRGLDDRWQASILDIERLLAGTRAWFAANDDHVFSCQIICSELGIDPNALRAHVAADKPTQRLRMATVPRDWTLRGSYQPRQHRAVG